MDDKLEQQLRDRIAILEEEIIQLRGLLIPSIDFLNVPLTAREREILSVLVASAGRIVSNDYFMTLLSSEKDMGIDPNTVKVFIFKIRRKIKRHGVEIQTHRGVGYSLSKEACSRLKELEG